MYVCEGLIIDRVACIGLRIIIRETKEGKEGGREPPTALLTIAPFNMMASTNWCSITFLNK